MEGRAGQVRASRGQEGARAVQVIRSFQHGRAIQGSLGAWTGSRIVVTTHQDKGDNQGYLGKTRARRSGVGWKPSRGIYDWTRLRRGSERVQAWLSRQQQLQSQGGMTHSVLTSLHQIVKIKINTGHFYIKEGQLVLITTSPDQK